MVDRESALEEKKGKMLNIIKDLKSRMRELDKMQKELESGKKPAPSTQKSHKLIEEIIVPPLELLKDTDKK